jgi:hypothetical protein
MVENSPFLGPGEGYEGSVRGVERSDENSFSGLMGRRRGKEKVFDMGRKVSRCLGVAVTCVVSEIIYSIVLRKELKFLTGSVMVLHI